MPDRGSRPLLFVGNHTLYGLYDLPFIMMELYLRGYKVAAPSSRSRPLVFYPCSSSKDFLFVAFVQYACSLRSRKRKEAGG